MYLTSREVQSMDEATLNVFIGRKLQEGRHLDYKLRYEKPASYDGKKEFLKDATGMANAGGGTIIIGVEESAEGDGLPGKIIGIDDGENLTQMWENLAKSCIDPRIPGIFAQPISLSSGKNVVIIYIPTSLRKPHMVIIDKHRGFYIRHNRDMVPMSVDEIRTAILLVEGALDKAQVYLLARELDIRQTRMFNPCPLLLQALPIIPLETDIDPLSEKVQSILLDRENKLAVEGVTLKSNISPSPILWGVEAGSSQTNPRWLTEIHRNGYIQALIFTTQKKPNSVDIGDRWLTTAFKKIFQSFIRLCDVLTENHQISTPYLIRVKWIGARGGYFVKLQAPGFEPHEVFGPWQLDDLTLPDIVHQPGDPWQPIADKLFTYLCNAFGTTG